MATSDKLGVVVDRVVRRRKGRLMRTAGNEAGRLGCTSRTVTGKLRCVRRERCAHRIEA